MTDAFLDLSLGLTRAGFESWAQCFLPGASGGEILEILRLRASSADDVSRLFALSVRAAAECGVSRADCFADISFSGLFPSARAFAAAVSSLSAGFPGIELRAFLRVEACSPDVFALLGSGAFAGVCFGGIAADGDLVRCAANARRLGLSVCADARPAAVGDALLRASSPDSVVVSPSSPVPPSAEVLAEIGASLVVTPDSAPPSDGFRSFLRSAAGAGVPVSSGSGARLLHGISSGEFASSLGIAP